MARNLKDEEITYAGPVSLTAWLTLAFSVKQMG